MKLPIMTHIVILSFPWPVATIPNYYMIAIYEREIMMTTPGLALASSKTVMEAVAGNV